MGRAVKKTLQTLQTRRRTLGHALTLALIASSCVVAAQDGRITVYKSNGSLQCEPESGVTVTAMGETLTAAGISVYSSKNISDGMMHAQVCGAPTGRLNLYEIDEGNLAKAEAMGFQVLRAPE
jgi:hypothetical protein